MSLQTTLAQAETLECERRWRDHKAHCPVCTRAVRSRHWADMCGEGGRLRRNWKEAVVILTHERELDRKPAPGQEGLW